VGGATANFDDEYSWHGSLHGRVRAGKKPTHINACTYIFIYACIHRVTLSVTMGGWPVGRATVESNDEYSRHGALHGSERAGEATGYMCMCLCLCCVCV